MGTTPPRQSRIIVRLLVRLERLLLQSMVAVSASHGGLFRPPHVLTRRSRAVYQGVVEGGPPALPTTCYQEEYVAGWQFLLRRVVLRTARRHGHGGLFPTAGGFLGRRVAAWLFCDASAVSRGSPGRRRLGLKRMPGEAPAILPGFCAVGRGICTQWSALALINDLFTTLFTPSPRTAFGHWHSSMISALALIIRSGSLLFRVRARQGRLGIGQGGLCPATRWELRTGRLRRCVADRCA